MPRELVRTERKERRCGKADGSAWRKPASASRSVWNARWPSRSTADADSPLSSCREFRLLAFLLDAAVVLDLGVLVALGVHRDGRLAIEEAAEQRVELGDAVVRGAKRRKRCLAYVLHRAGAEQRHALHEGDGLLAGDREAEAR